MSQHEPDNADFTAACREIANRLKDDRAYHQALVREDQTAAAVREAASIAHLHEEYQRRAEARGQQFLETMEAREGWL
jgi:hypothetical protein